MNVSNLIIRLQKLVEQSTNPNELMILGKSIEKIKVGNVDTVATFADLPTLPLAEDGELFLVEADEDLYFNVGSTWDRFRPFVFDAMSWGANDFGLGAGGSLGDGTNIHKSSPVTVVGGITNWSQVSAGDQHSLGVTADGIAYAWGSNGNFFLGFSGCLGDESTESKSSPITVVGGITNWSQVSAGSSRSLGIADGIAYAWGIGTSGEIGDGTTISKSSPVTVIGGITNWSQVSAGNGHSLGVTDTGIAYAWGGGLFGPQGVLGDGTTISKSSPVTVIGGITNWSQVSAGNGHSLGVTANGIAYAWGYGAGGRLGDGTTISRSSPVTVVGGITNWSQVSARSGHSLGVTDDGIAYAWGQSGNGELGDGTRISRSSPVTVVGGITNWSQVSAGGNHSLGLASDGIAYAWGSNYNGILGDGTTVTRSSPVTVVGGITNWSQVSAGRDHSLAIKSQ